MRAVSVSEYVVDLVGGPPVGGRAVAVFDRTAYVGLGGCEFLCLGVASVGNGPFTVLIAPTGQPLSGLVQPGDECAVGGNCVRVGALHITTAGAPVWASSWHTAAPRPGDPAVPEVWERLALAKRILRQEGNAQSLGWMLTFCSETWSGRGAVTYTSLGLGAVCRGLALLRSGLASGRGALVGEGARALVGLGPGLTPSGDDLFAGFMVGVQLACRVLGVDVEGWQRWCGAVVRDLAPRTTPVSAAYLQCAARGVVSEQVDGLLSALLGRGVVADAAPGVLRLGSWSGSDLMAGLLAGVEAGLAGLGRRGVIVG